MSMKVHVTVCILLRRVIFVVKALKQGKNGETHILRSTMGVYGTPEVWLFSPYLNCYSVSNVSMSVIDKCDRHYHIDVWAISSPAPSIKMCQCRYKFFSTCEGSFVTCDISLPKSVKLDRAKKTCHLGQGDCDGC